MNALVSTGLLFRLSCLICGRERLLADLKAQNKVMMDNRRQLEWLLDQEDAVAPKALRQQIHSFLHEDAPDVRLALEADNIIAYLVLELNQLVESIVLSDQLYILSGFRDPRSKGVGLQPWIRGWGKFQGYIEEGSRLLNYVGDVTKAERFFSEDQLGLETGHLLAYLDNRDITYLRKMTEGRRVTEDDFVLYVYDMGLGWSQAKSFDEFVHGNRTELMRWRGKDYCSYYSHFSKFFSNLPLEAILSAHDISSSYLEFSLSLYDEISASVEVGGMAFPTWSRGTYLAASGMQQQATDLNLASFFFQSSDTKIKKELEEFGFTTANFSVPPLLRYCSVDAESVYDIIAAAERLRKSNPAIRLRRYFESLSKEEDVTKLASRLKRVEELRDQTHSVWRDSIPASVTLSTGGTAGVSVANLISKFTAKRNPVVMFDSSLYKNIGKSNALNALGEITKTERVSLGQALRRVGEWNNGDS